MDDLQEPFMTTKSSGVGMGLGLAISAQIAKDMNGTIEAQDARHSGAEFTLWLPLSEEHP
jgi:two-component system, NtrC family, C4-dicarboxylate transport sensor histidine kinase DctB